MTITDDGRFGDIIIDGKHYRVDVSSYKGRDVSDFAPRASSPGGQILYSQLDLYQPVMQTDWRHGYGFHWHTDAMGYQKVVNNVDTRQAGYACLMTQPSIYQLLAESVVKISIDHSGRYLLVIGPTGFYTHDINTTAWNRTSNAPNPVIYFWQNGTYTFAVTNGGYIYRTKNVTVTLWTTTPHIDGTGDANDPTTHWVACGRGTTPYGFTWLVAHNGAVYAGKYNTNEVYQSTQMDLMDLEGNTTDNPSAMLVGPKGRSTNGACSFNGDLVIFRADAIYKADKASGSFCTTASKVVDFSDSLSGANLASWAVFNSQLYFSIRGILYAWNGTRLSNVTPPRIIDVWPYNTYNYFANLTVADGRLYLYAACLDDTVASHTLFSTILCYDGVGWFNLIQTTAGDVNPFGAMYYMSQVTSLTTGHYFLWFSIGSYIFGLPFSENPNLPYPYFPTQDPANLNSLYLSKMDAGYRIVRKSTPSILVEGYNLSPGVTWLEIYYSIDGGSFLPWGTIDHTTNVVTVNGTNELRDPLGNANGFTTLEYKWIQFRIDFYTTVVTQTPILESFTLRVIMRPTTSYGWSFHVHAQPNLQYGTNINDRRSPKEIIMDLRTARDSGSPVVFRDIYGDTHHVYLTSINEIAGERLANPVKGQPDISSVIVVNLVAVDGARYVNPNSRYIGPPSHPT